MKYLNFKYILLFIVVYVFALAAMFPVKWAVPTLEPMLSSVGVSLGQVEGSIWQGKAVVSHKQMGDVQVKWRSKPWHLFRLALPIDVTAVGQYFDFKALVAPSVFGLTVSDLTGYVDEQALTPWLQPYRVSLQGRLQVDQLSVESSWRYKLGDASGSVSYSGGPISVPVGRSVQQYQVPTMIGQLSSNEQQWQMLITDTNKQEFIAISLERTGLGTLSVKRALAEVMDIPLPPGGRSLLDVSQQVF